MTDTSMNWLLDSLRIVREVRDWASTRRKSDTTAEASKQALEQATKSLETYARDMGLLPELLEEPSLVAPLGPAPQLRPRESEESSGAADTVRADSRLTPEDIDPQAISSVRRLRRYGYKAYLVGGCVRDLLLGMAPKDFDIATDARPEEVKAVFRNSRIIGRRFRLVHLYFRGGKVLEVATFRAAVAAEEEEPGGADLLIRRDNVFGTEEEDARRRDFTINGLFYDPESGQIIDYVGGLADIDNRIVRMIGDPDVRLREDPVRIVRAIRFRAKADLTIEPTLEAALGRHVEELVRCPPARLLEETLKLLRMGHAEAAFQEMMEHGVVDVLLPDLQAFFSGHWSMLAGSSVLDDRPEPYTEVRRHLAALDEVFVRGPVSDEVVLGALLYPMAEAVQAHAEEVDRDRSKAVTEFLGKVGGQLQFTKRLAEQLRQALTAQKHFPNEAPRRRRRVPPSTFMRRSFFSTALRLYEIHQRASELGLDDVEHWEKRAAGENIAVESPLTPEGQAVAQDQDPASRRRRRSSGRRRRSSASRSSS